MKIIKRFWLLFFLGLFIYVGLLFSRNIVRFSNFENELNDLQNEHVRLEFFKQRYIATLDNLNTSDWWVLEAKKKMGYSQQGEIVYKYYE